MRPLRSGVFWRALLGAAVMMASVGGLASSGPAAAEGDRAALALGDSVGFGFITQDGFAYGNPNNFVGFPEHVGQNLHLQMTNASCPGETTGSLISTANPDNGCKAFRGGGAPLHVAYVGSQLDFAKSFLKHHPETRLVTLQAGANDAFLLQDSCAGNALCIQSHFGALLTQIGQNLDLTIKALRADGFHGILVVVNYYSTDYTDALNTGLIHAIDLDMQQVATANGAVTADAFAAFQAAATNPFATGHTCRAALLNVDPQDNTKCDVHPSQSGQELLANTVDNAYHAALAREDGSDN